MSNAQLPAVWSDPGISIMPYRSSPLVRRGLEHLASQQVIRFEPGVSDQAVIHFSMEFAKSVRQIVKMAGSEEPVKLNIDQDWSSWCCLYSAIRGEQPFSGRAKSSVANATQLILEEPRIWREEAIVFQLIEDVIGTGKGEGFAELYNHLDHHLTALRWQLHQLAWLVRSRLRAQVAARHLLWNAAVLLGGWEESLALLLNLCGTEERFWHIVNSHITYPWEDKRRLANLMECLVRVHDEQDEARRTFLHPGQLITFERDVQHRVEEYVGTIHVQQRLL